MKHIATMALMLNLGVAGVYAHEKPVKMIFSGTGGAGEINLQQPDTANIEEREAGNGTLGPFTFRIISAGTTSPQPSVVPERCVDAQTATACRLHHKIVPLRYGQAIQPDRTQGA